MGRQLRALSSVVRARARRRVDRLRRRRESRAAVALVVSATRRVRFLTPNRPLTLRLANLYSGEVGEPAIALFADEVARLSGGSVRVRVIGGWVRRGDRDEERTLLNELASGLADLGCVATRAVGATFGFHSLDALWAPLLFADYVSVADAVCGPLGDELRELPRRIGLVGLAIVPGPFRRPLGLTRALVCAADWRGAVIRTHTSLVGEATLRTLGAVPVLRHASELAGPLPPGIDGLEIQADGIRTWGYAGQFTWNVRLWPRTLLLAANRRAVQRSGAAVEALLREAAARTATRVAGTLEDGEEDEARAIPPETRVVTASAAELAELRDTVEPVYETLRAEPAARRVLERLERALSSGRGGS